MYIYLRQVSFLQASFKFHRYINNDANEISKYFLQRA